MKETNTNSRAHECSILGCPRKTGNLSDRIFRYVYRFVMRRDNPRRRWMLNLQLKDDDGSLKIINLCPAHAKEFFLIGESDYVALERAEKLVRENIEQRPV